MTKVLIDINVIIDLVAEREPFVAEAIEIFRVIDRKRARGFVAALGFPNLHYFFTKHKGASETGNLLRNLADLITILPVDEKNILRALESDFPDFEDAIQYFCALHGNVDAIVTRNLKDFKKSALPVYSPAAFLARQA